jgi:hypothetical protein
MVFERTTPKTPVPLTPCMQESANRFPRGHLKKALSRALAGWDGRYFLVFLEVSWKLGSFQKRKKPDHYR